MQTEAQKAVAKNFLRDSGYPESGFLQIVDASNRSGVLVVVLS
jgi:hypothetical protein